MAETKKEDPPAQDPGVRALSLERPWPHLILTGEVTALARSEPTEYRGLVALHAGRRLDPDIVTDLYSRGEVDLAAEALGFVGVVRIVDVHEASKDCVDSCKQRKTRIRGRRRRFHWVLTDPHPFGEAIPGRGRQGLFLPPAKVSAAARELTPAA